jgi:hypothetical protein
MTKFKIGQLVKILFIEREEPTNSPYPSGVPAEIRFDNHSLVFNGGTVLDVMQRDGETWYQVGGQVADNPDELWNADFRENELEAV